MLLAEKLYSQGEVFNGPWNFGPDDAAMRTVGNLAEEIVQCWGSGVVRVAPDANAPHEAGLLHLNCDKARFQLEWQPKWGFEQAVMETVAWYKAYFAKSNIEDMAQGQIKSYMGQAGF